MTKGTKKKTAREQPFHKKVSFIRFLIGGLLFVLIYAMLAFFSMPARFDLEVGKPSPRTVYAPRDAIDEYTTEMLRTEAEEAVPNVFDYEPLVLETVLNSIGQFFDRVLTITEDPELEEEDKIKALKALLSEDFSDEVVSSLITDNSVLRELQGRLNSSVTEVFEQGIKENDLDLVKRRLNQEIALYPFNADLKRIAEHLVIPLVEQNMFFNPEATEQNRALARRQVEPVVILRNTLIVSEGEPINEVQLAQLEELGLVRGQQADYPGYIGLFIFLVIVFVLASIFISIFVREVFDNPKYLTLMGFILIITLIFSVAANLFLGYLIPVAMGVILITVIFGYKLAVIINLVLALMVGLITGGNYSFILVALLGGLVSIYAVTRLSQRSDLARAGFHVAMTNAAVILSTYLFYGNVSLEYDSLVSFSYSLIAGIGNGILSSVIAIGLLPFLESMFGVTSGIKLLELSNPNHRLLKDLLFKAPGTYYHSMMVSNLAESAAEAVKADSLLARVGAYYHDIGKLKRPVFFSENQLTGDNPHSRLSPNLSALVIGSHPKDGLELARKHRLPEVIQDIIEQHHGTSMISFFYQKALESKQAHEVSPDSFRYYGPRPQTKEAAIIMLADAVEAGVRSLSNPNSNRVEAMTKRMVKDKLEDGQLDNSDLTLKEIDQITEAFIYIMSGIYHSRIEYPEKDLKAELERSK